MTRDEYYQVMTRSKVVLCPSGPVTVDTFRVCEALEAGCIPVVDDRTPNPSWPSGYWNYVFGSEKLPFPVVQEWKGVTEIIEHWAGNFDELGPICKAWWEAQELIYIADMAEDLNVG